MKLPRLVHPASIVLALFVFCVAGSPHAIAASDVMLIDFADSRRDPDGKVFHAYEYAYQDWNKRVTDLRGRGVLVKAPSGKGGIGENRTMVKFDKTPQVELWIVIGNANKAKSMTFALTDRDGTENQWNLPFAGRATGQLLRYPIDLTKADGEQKPGKTAGLDLKKIASWQVRGDFTDPSIEVLLVKLTGAK